MYIIHHTKEIAWLPVEKKDLPADVATPKNYIDKDGAQIVLSGHPDYMMGSDGVWLKRGIVEKDNYTTLGNLSEADIEHYQAFLLEHKNVKWNKGRVVVWFLEDNIAKILPPVTSWTSIEVDNDPKLEKYLNDYFELKKGKN